MAIEGQYEEKLPCGGSLLVKATDWTIRYYFPGIDARYKGTFPIIQGRNVESHIKAYQENWNDFEKLKQSIPTGGEFSKPGKMDMTIRISKFSQGVCVASYHLPMASKSQLDMVISSYQYAIGRATLIQSLLRALPKDA